MLNELSPQMSYATVWRTRRLVLIMSLVGLAWTAGSSDRLHAQSEYPNRPVRIIVPSSAGGGTDTVARLAAQYLSERLGQQFFIENRPGAGSMTGIEAGARATPDGYTLLAVASTMTSLPVVHANMRFDPVRDFSPISEIVSIPNVLAVHPSVPARSLADLVALAKAEPGRLSYATPGLGSTTHMAMELLKTRAGIELLHVPYSGVAPALTDVLGGRVPVMMVNAASAKSHLDNGSLRVLAVTSRERAPFLPDVPTIAESGLPDYEALQWFGLLAPAGTPPVIVDRIRAEIADALRTRKFIEWMAAEGAVPVGNAPAQFAAVIASEVALWASVGQAANIKPR